MKTKHVCALTLWLMLPSVGVGQEAGGGTIPTPESVLGFEIGADRVLADWSEITGYLNALADASDRVLLDTLGETTLGRPFVALTISSAANLEGLDHYLEVQRRLADPRRIESEMVAEDLIREGRTVVLITGGIHSTEVGGYQVPMRLAYHLAAGDDELTRTILDNVILLLVPSLNPDGSQMTVDWYESTIDQPWEGAGPPFLYHHYVGHDNNRDWYAFTQVETQLTVSKLHNVWHPQIVHDIHQMGSTGPRFFIPPWTDPVEPNVDPLLVAGINAIGTAMAWEMYSQGKTGIVVNAIFDAWTPARAYQHYHGGARILTETASARLATPISLPFDSLQARRDADPRQSSWRFPDPWPGGEWHLSDIVDYMESGALALLKQAALYRERWLSNFYQIGLRAIGGSEGRPSAYFIPVSATDNPDGRAELIRILVTGDVEIRQARSGFAHDGRQYPAGTFVVPMDQPYSLFAKTLLERQHYPALEEYPGGPLRTPYDATAHTLPLLMGVEVVAVEKMPDVELTGTIEPQVHEKTAPGLAGGEGPRVAIYEPWWPLMDAGWTRWVFDSYGIEYVQLRDADARAGDLRTRFDAIILPDGSAERMIEGHEEGTMPAEYVGGLGQAGVAALAQFVETGGTLIAFNRASMLPIEQFALPVKDVVEGLERTEFYVPGSILRLNLDPGHWLAQGSPTRTVAWFERGLAFEAVDVDGEAEGGAAASVEIAGRYGEDDLLLSGWITGDEYIAGQGAIAVVSYGQGRIILFGFKPQYRGQTVATYPLIFNALKGSTQSTSTSSAAGGVGGG